MERGWAEESREERREYKIKTKWVGKKKKGINGK
jgi:hypothetical protein